jgi:PAS domain S-box-containing protein
MIGTNTNKDDLIKKLETLQHRVTELEELESKHKQAESAMPNNQTIYNLLAENTTDLIWKVNVDSPNRLNYISPSITNLLGYTVEEAMSTTMEGIFTPESYIKAMEVLLQEIACIDKKYFDQHQSIRLELEAIHKNGLVVPIEVNFSFILGNERRPVEILAVGRDITERKLAEAQLRQSESKYHSLVEKGNDGVVIIQDGVLKFANSRMVDITGSPIEEVIGRSFLDFVSPKYRTLSADKYKKRINGEKTALRYEIELLPKEGRSMPVEISGSVIEHEGRPADMVVIRDITERKKAEQQQKEIEEELKTYLENAPDGVYINDLKGVFLYGNKRAEEILGYKREELVGSNFLKLNLVPSKQLARAGKLLALNVMGKNTGPDEFELIKKDKSSIWAEINTSPIKFGHKSVVIGFVRDITERKQIQEKLQGSEERLSAIINNAPIGIATSGADRHFVNANDAFCKILGYSESELQRLTFKDVTFSDDVKDSASLMEELDNGKIPSFSQEKRYNKKNGQVINGKVVVSLIRAQDGKPVMYIAELEDITERKRAEEALKASEQNFRNSINNSSMGIRIMGDSDSTVYANHALLNIFGYKDIDELRASPPHEHYTRESYAGYCKRREQFSHGESLSNQLDIDIIRKDGNIRHLQLSSQEVLWDGKQQHQFIYTDITEQNKTEKKLEQAAQEWRTTFDSITDLISIHDKDNRIIRVNHAVADLLKTTPQELIGKFCREVMRGDQECPVNCPHLLALKTGKPSSLEIFNSKLGIHFQESASPIFNESGEIIGSVVVARDVTKQKRMEEQLIMTDRLASIGELSSGIAHELNNPLTSVIGFSQLLMEGDVPEDIKKYLGIVYSESQRAAAIVKNLLTFARKHAPIKQLSQVNTVIEDVLRLRAYEQKVNNIEVESRLAPNLPETMIDHFQMQQVFLNIVVNAEFAMQEAHQRGKLTITTESPDGIVRITFTDDGPGISQENLKHIFDPFFTTKEVGKGTGLGLSICHGIITEHSGKIYVRSKEGMGASFIIELPINE